MKHFISNIITQRITRKIDFTARFLLFAVSILLFGALVIDYGFELSTHDEIIIGKIYTAAWWCYFTDFFCRIFLQWSSIRRKAVVITAIIGICLLLTALPKLFPDVDLGILSPIWSLFSHKYFIITLLGILSVLNISKSIIEFISQNTNPACY